MSDSNTRYTIIDSNGCELPPHYSGRYRTDDGATKLVRRLNISGEYRPYKKVPVTNRKSN